MVKRVKVKMVEAVGNRRSRKSRRLAGGASPANAGGRVDKRASCEKEASRYAAG